MDDNHRMVEAIRLAVEMYEQGARGSGRTSRMIAEAQPGDVIVLGDTHGAAYRHHIERALRDAGKMVGHGADRVLVVTLRPGTHLEELRASFRDARLLIDHTLALEWIRNAVGSVARELRHISGENKAARDRRKEREARDAAKMPRFEP